MTKAQQARIMAWRLRILQWTEGEPRQVARTCRHFGYERNAKCCRCFDNGFVEGDATAVNLV